MADRPAGLRVEDDNIGVAARGELTLAGVQPEVAGRVRARHLDEAGPADPPRHDPEAVQQGQAQLQPGGAIGHGGEVRGGRLLLEGEGAVVGADETQRPVGQRRPQRLLVGSGAQRGAHHGDPRGQFLAVLLAGQRRPRLPVCRVVQHEVLRAGLGDQPAAPGPGRPHLGRGRGRTEMHDVVVGPDEVGDRAQPHERLALQLRRVHHLVVVGPGVPGGQLALGERVDDPAVLAVEADRRAQRRARGEGGKHLVVLHHHRMPIGEVELERGHALGDHVGQFRGERGLPLRHREMEGVVGDCLPGRLLVPARQPLREALPVELGGEVDDRRGAPGQRRAGAGREVVGSGQLRPALQVEVAVRLDAPGHDEHPRAIEHRLALVRGEPSDLEDRLAVEAHVSGLHVLRRHDQAACEESLHRGCHCSSGRTGNVTSVPRSAVPQRDCGR